METTTLSSPTTRGHKKKARTRQRLLDAAMEVLAEHGESFTIADVSERAGVSHGTFYNYFADRDELLAALVPHIVSRFAEHMAEEVAEIDPAVRFARISAEALEVALHEPQMIQVALRLDDVQQELLAGGSFARLRADLLDGFTSGRFTSPADDGTLDVITGSLLLAARRIAAGESAESYRRSILQRLLHALGVADPDANEIARDAVATSARRV